MDVVDRYQEDEMVQDYSGLLIHAQGQSETVSRAVLLEHRLEIVINTVPTMRVICTPDHLVDLIIGRLFTEGIIHGVQDVERIYLCDQGTRASVMLSSRSADFTRTSLEQVPSCCTGNRTYNSYFSTNDRPQNVVPIAWDRQWIFTAAQAFAEDSPLHKTTTGTHSCYLLRDGELLLCCEDLGRHNPFDKVIGAALRSGIDLREVLIFSSGRLPEDMVMKAIRAGIPILATKAVPTDETIRLAREFDLTLVCQARPDSAVIYNDPISKGSVYGE